MARWQNSQSLAHGDHSQAHTTSTVAQQRLVAPHGAAVEEKRFHTSAAPQRVTSTARQPKEAPSSRSNQSSHSPHMGSPRWQTMSGHGMSSSGMA